MFDTETAFFMCYCYIPHFLQLSAAFIACQLMVPYVPLTFNPPDCENNSPKLIKTAE